MTMKMAMKLGGATSGRAFGTRWGSAVVALGVSAAALLEAGAQTSYTLYDLTPADGNGSAKSLSGGVAAGQSAAAIYSTLTRAALWDETGLVNLHPIALLDTAAGTPSRSSVEGIAGDLQVGWGAGAATGSRLVPLAWRGSAASATILAMPFANSGAQATATDGRQIVGYGNSLTTDGAVGGPSRGVVWDALTGVGTDLGDGGNGALVYGVGGGKQVGYVNKGAINAAVWSGTSRSLVVLHPKGAVVSVANGTDGLRQVGYAGYDIRVRQEAAKGKKDARFNYAMVWSGTSASALNIHPYPINAAPDIVLSHSYALAINGSRIVGYAGDQSKFGTPAYSHAIVWDANYESVDLNAFLPAGFVGAQALAVDADGNIAGFMAKADGTRHAVLWVPDNG